MADYTGNFQYIAENGSVLQQGDCRFQFDKETLTLTPESAAPIAFDLGDLDGVIAGHPQLKLPLYTGRTLVLRQLGKAFERIAHDLLEAFRDRAAQCLLVGDLKEVARFDGRFELATSVKCSACGARTQATKFCRECGKPLSSQPSAARSGEAEIRLYESNFAVLPTAAVGFQWRLADVDAVREDNHEIALDAGDRTLRISGLGKRSDDFARKLRDTVNTLATNSAQAIHRAFPFLNPDQLQATAAVLREGRSALVAKLAAIHGKMPAALAANAVDGALKPYYDELLKRTAHDLLYAGFKLIRPEDREGSPAESATESTEQSPEQQEDLSTEGLPDADSSAPDTMYWFFFPLAATPGSSEPGNVVAWEASSTGGRATYFFRLVELSQAGELKNNPALVEESIRTLNAALGILNFRRRPIYLSDDEIEMNPQFHRYAIAARRIPEVRQLRSRFLGRAIHSSPEAWQEQLKSILSKGCV
ncbi:MAG TPA: hypothetical protein VII81_02700 [Terriglobales bacterium]